jgi:HNH endonuclease
MPAHQSERERSESSAHFKSLFPTASHRREFARFLVALIKEAHPRSPEAWSLTVNSTFIRLNVGRTEFAVAGDGKLFVVADAATLPRSLPPAAEATRAEYVSPRDFEKVRVVIPTNATAAVLPLLADACRRIVAAAADQWKGRTPHWRATPQDVAKTLSELSGIADVPEPGYLSPEHLLARAAENPDEDEIESAFEGEMRVAYVAHRRRERRLREAKIAETLRRNKGRLRCEVPRCGFEFEKIYGDNGAGYAHVHHLDRLVDGPPRETSLENLAVVCANCHAIIHRGGENRDLEDLIPALPSSKSKRRSAR